MRIARIGSLSQPVPAVEYGGTQRSMAQMTAFQAAIRGHDITLYAPSDSGIIDFTRDIASKLNLASSVSTDGLSIDVVNANGKVGRVRLESAGLASIGYDIAPEEEDRQHAILINALLRDEAARPFDLVHCHVRKFMGAGLVRSGLHKKTVVHQHNAVLEASYQRHPYPLICISDSQAELMRSKYSADVLAVVPHGLDSFTHSFSATHAGYLAWIGRFLPDKGADRAIKIAKAANMPLVIAGMIYEKKPESARHFNEDVLPRVDHHDPEFLNRTARMQPAEVRAEICRIQAETGMASPVIFAGPANDAQKQALYGNAMATLFPISWPEPFGRVMIESMACGTPVVSYRSYEGIDCGAVREVIDDGVTGYTFDAHDARHAIDSAVRGVYGCMHLDRANVRQIFDMKWTSERVARQLDDVYRFYMAALPGVRPLPLHADTLHT